MNFKSIIQGLYKGTDYKICYILNTGSHSECKENIDEWYEMYNVKNNSFRLIPIQHIKWIDKYTVECIVLPDNRNITSFQVIGYVTNEDFPLHPKRELTLYKAKNFHVRESTYLEEGRRYHLNEERKNIET